MPISFVRQGTSGTGASVTSVAPSFGSNTTVGNAVVLLSGSASGSHISSASGFGVTVWTDLKQQTGSNVTNEIWGAITLSAGTSVTVNYSASSNVACLIAEVSGVTLTLDGSNSSTTGSLVSPVTPGSITTVNANDIVISSINTGGSTTVTDPTSPWNGLTRATGGSSSGKVGTDAVYQIVSSTGSFNPGFTVTGGTGGASATIVALQATAAAATPYFLQPLAHRQARKVVPPVRAKRALKGAGALFHPWAPQPPFPVFHHAQKRRAAVVKAKPRVRNRWLIERQVTAPHADFPEQVRRQAQKRRIPRVKAKPIVRSSLELRIPQAPHADLPLSARHQRGQTKRLPHIKAKRVTRSSMELRIPQAPPAILPPELRHYAQKKRVPQVKAKRRVRSSVELTIPGPLRLQTPVAAHRGQKPRLPVVKAKRAVRSSLELRIPQAPPSTLPLSVRHQRGQPRRLPSVKAKRVVRSSIELRIPQAPSATPPLPIEARRAQRKRAVLTLRRQHRTSPLFRIALASVLSPILARRHRARVSVVHPKRVVRGSSQLRIPQAPAVQVAQPPIGIKAKSPRKHVWKVAAKRRVASSLQLRIPQAPSATLPLPNRHSRGQTRRLPTVKAKRSVRSSIELRIPQAPTIVAPLLPLSLRRGLAQRKRAYRLDATRKVRSRLILALLPTLALPRSRVDQRTRLLSAQRRKVTRGNAALRILQGLTLRGLPLTLRHSYSQAKRFPKVRARHTLRSAPALRFLEAAPPPPISAPIAIRNHFKRKSWHGIRAKRVAVSKFMQLSKTLAPFVPPALEAIVIWRHRANIQ